jgi:hypothetical protein
MTLRRLAILQWAGLFLGAATWATQFVLGYGVTEARCSQVNSRWGLDNDPWQASLAAVAVALILLAEASAATVLVRTRASSYEDDPPVGRIRFFAVAAVVANLFFLTIVVLSGVASIVNIACRQA